MKFTTTILTTLAATTAAMPSSSSLVSSLKRDPTGSGFTHISSDNIARSYDASLNLLDAVHLSGRDIDGASHAAARDEAVAVRRRSMEEMMTMKRSVLERQEDTSNCVARLCPDDNYCKGLSIYGYNCTTCFSIGTAVMHCGN